MTRGADAIRFSVLALSAACAALLGTVETPHGAF